MARYRNRPRYGWSRSRYYRRPQWGSWYSRRYYRRPRRRYRRWYL